MSLTNFRTRSFVKLCSSSSQAVPAPHRLNAGVIGVKTSFEERSDRAPQPSLKAAMPLFSTIGGDHGPGRQPNGMFRMAHLIFALVKAADVVIVIASGLLASILCAGFHLSGNDCSVFTIPAVTTATVLALTIALSARTDDPGTLSRRLRDAMVTMAVGCLVGETFWMVSTGSLTGGVVWQAWWSAFAAGSALLMIGMTAPLSHFPGADSLALRVAVVGLNGYSKGFVDRLRNDPTGSVRFVGLYDDRGTSTSYAGEHVLGSISDLVQRTRTDRVDAIVLALPLSDQERIVRARSALGSVISDIYVAAHALNLTCKASRTDRLGDCPVIKVASRPLTEWQSVQKTVFDCIIAGGLLLAALPMLAVVAIAIKIDSPGPVFFKQQRLGYNNLVFSVFKFRTMYHDMADAHADRQTTRSDPRITRIGKFLRKTSIDELPQLWNVLKGEMSLVGPRPHAANTKAGNQLFHEVVADYALRHRVKPGISGWAQVNGWRGETRTFEQLEQRVAHDLYYIDNWSLKLDFKIIALTALRELNSKVAF